MLQSSIAKSKPMYSFPELKQAEILQCMEDLKIPIADTDLTKPTPFAVQRMLEAFAEIFMGVSKEAYSQPDFSKLDFLEYPDIHADAISLVSFYRVISRLMGEVGVDDFGLKDIIRPDPPRLRIILSAVINFAKFREEQLSLMEELSRRTDEINDHNTRLLRQKTELALKISAIEYANDAHS